MSQHTARPAAEADFTAIARQVAAARQRSPGSCSHPPERIYAWWAYNCRTGKNDILCAACCDCGAVLAGGASLDDEEVLDAAIR